ncbi:MAG: PAS domain-containing protein [Acidobacteria bacterium]|nr:PAS domain-containing protein [Acidobacteriota bacterium]
MTELTLSQLISGLAADGGPDLRGYKLTTLERRIRRRMSELNIGKYGDYLDFVRRTQHEPSALLNTVLINVTEFFRDPPAWEYLRTQMLPRLFQGLRPGDTFRVWTAGCATGEEAYSIALLLAERLGEDLNHFDLKIYGTDIDDDALAVARRGEYAAEKLRRVRPELRERFFMASGRGFRVNREVRRLLIFGRSNLVSNAPISHCQLVICRNVLIYFDTNAQKRILERLHYALDPGGILFLGKAESKLSESRLFGPVNSRWRIFQRLPSGDGVAAQDQPYSGAEARKQENDGANARMFQQHILEAMRAGVIALDANDIVLTHNDAALAQWGISAKIAGRRLQNTELVFRCPEMMARLESTRAGHHQSVAFQCAIKNNGSDDRLVAVVLRPVMAEDGQRLGTVIYCDDITDREKLQGMLEQFEATSEELQSANEELETTNEELQSTNEELETTNEELQSSNEELETTNEELQSLNEELENMNEELEQRTQELTEVNSRYTGTLESMPWPVVLADSGEKIQLWNTAAQQLFGIGATSVVGVSMDRLPLEAGARKALIRRYRSVMSRGRASVLPGLHLRNHGDLGQFDIHFTPVSRITGKTDGVLIMFGPPGGGRQFRRTATSTEHRNAGAANTRKPRR